MASAKSKVEYLKRYGYKPEDSSSKKKTKKVKKIANAGKVVPKSTIVDDDIDINAVAPNDNDFELETGEDAPQIAGLVDERPMEIQKMEAFASNKWRVLGMDDNGETGVKSPQNHENRRRRHDSNSDNSLVNDRVRHDSDSDASPPRQRSHQDSDASPPRIKVRQDSDVSPPRQRSRDDSDVSPPRQRSRHDSDASLPRRKAKRSASPPSRHKVRNNDNVSDSSPPRHKPGSSPKRIKMRHNSDSSPPRRKSVKDRAASPPRRNFDKHSARTNEKADQNKRIHAKVASDYFPSRRNKSVSDSDSSPPRNNSSQTKQISLKNGESDARYSSRREKDSSTCRHRKKISQQKQPPYTRKADSNSDSDPSPPRKSRESLVLQKKTLDGKKAGLQDSRTLKMENEAAKKREKRLFEKMDEEISGKNAQTILRDRSTGMRRNLEEENRKQMEEDAIKAEREAKYNQWGKGMKQTEMQNSNLQQAMKEMSKPLARYEDDEDLDKTLRDQDRDGDPMLAFIKKKKATKVDGKEYPKYNGPQPPPNRFGIMPGYRWDGVDRSCGFEKSRFARLSSKVAAEEEAYKWSVEDM